MCTEDFIRISLIILSFFTVELCFYIYRIEKSFRPSSKIFLCLVYFNLISIGIILGLHADSTCNRYYITWGSTLFAFYFCLTLVETFTFCSGSE